MQTQQAEYTESVRGTMVSSGLDLLSPEGVQRSSDSIGEDGGISPRPRAICPPTIYYLLKDGDPAHEIRQKPPLDEDYHQ